MHWTSSSIALTLSAALLLLAPAAHAQTPLAPGEVARVGDTPILKADFEHWRLVAEYALGLPENDEGDEMERAQTMRILISSEWIEGEAARVGVVVSPGAVLTVYRRLKRAGFPKEADFRKFVEESGMTVADFKRRVRSDMLSERIKAHAVRGAKTPEGRQRHLTRYEKRFTARWKAKTVCGEGYAIEHECGSVVPISA